jgi:hypothetical protein
MKFPNLAVNNEKRIAAKIVGNIMVDDLVWSLEATLTKG